MLSDKMATMQKNLEIMTKVNEIIVNIKPLVSNMKEAYETLNSFLESSDLNTMDVELKTAIVSICNIFESAYKGLEDESVSALFH